MTPEESKAIFEQVKANTAALKSCAGPHDFADITPDRQFGKRYRCTRCGGELDQPAVLWYRRGLEHGKR